MPACPSCGAQSRDGNAFCEDCGTPFAPHCPSCGAPVTPGKRFCGTCGTALVSATQPGVPAQPVASAGPLAERRVCSVLFCDLVGFTPLSESRDPEEVRELLSRYFDVARTVIERYGGIVEKFIGDAVMAVWGTPTATEGDAERAVRAGLDLVDAVAQLGRESQLPGLAARAGIVTGEVAVTLGATGQGMVAGDAVNTAARVQTAAKAGTVLVDEGTWRVAQAAVEFTAAGEHALKGKASLVPLWRADRVVSGVGGSQRIDGLEAPFVGRDTELRLIKELFHASAQRRTPRLVSVTGAAGVGKSRLGWEFFKYIDGLSETVWWHRGRCLAYGEGVAFWALAEMIRQRLGIAEDDPTEVAAEKLRGGLPQWLTDQGERDYVAPRVGQLLGTDAGSTRLPREELFAGWRLFVERLAAQAPVVLLIEDLHHADAGLLDFLEHLLDWARDVPIFVLTLARPELENRRAGWGAGRRNSTTLSLDPLDDSAMDLLLDGLVPGMPPAAKAAIAGRAEGIPLYAVETVRMLVDRDVVQPIEGVYRLVGDIGELAVPATLQSLLAARLDALEPTARGLIADAAVLGNSFPKEALVAITDLPEPEVDRLLGELVRREVLAVRADPLSPERGQYGFVQTMFRQVAYDTLSRRERKTRHLAVAAHLQRTFAAGGEEIAEVIAAHLLEALAAVPNDEDAADLRENAVEMLTRAGERAQRAGAPASAASSYAKAAQLLQTSTAASEHVAAAGLLERAGWAARTAADMATSVQHYREAADLYRKNARPRDAARADAGVADGLRRLGRLEDARILLRDAVAVLNSDPDADTVSALSLLALLEVFEGSSAEADRLSAEALVLAQALDVSDAMLPQLFITRGLALGSANRWAETTASLREAARRAEEIGDSVMAGRALANLAYALSISQAPAAAAEAARAAVTYCRRTGDADMMEIAADNLISALVMTGDWDEAEQVYATASRELAADQAAFVAYSILALRVMRGDRQSLGLLLSQLKKLSSGDRQDREVWAAAHAAVALASGDHRQALSYANSALRDAAAIGVDAIRRAWVAAADAALALGDAAEVRRLLEWLDVHPRGHVPPILRAERLRIAARLAALEADDDAIHVFDAATEAFRGLGSPYHLAVALLDHAQYLVASSDAASASPLIAEATGIATRLAAQPLLERAAQLTESTPPSAETAFSEPSPPPQARSAVR